MPLVVSCSCCQHRFKVRDAAVGGRVQCPDCGEAFVVRREADADEAEKPRDRGSPKSVANADKEPRDRGSSESDDDTYAVQSGADAAPPPPRRRDEGSLRRRRRPVSGPHDELEDRPDVRAHRGPLILTLGVLSVVLSCIPLAGWILGAMSMTMGTTDERLMEVGGMERSGHGMTRMGQICGIFGVFFSTVVFILALFLRLRRFAQ